MSDERLGGGTRRDNIMLTHGGLLAAAVVAGMATGAAIFVITATLWGWSSTSLASPSMIVLGGAVGGSVGLVPAYLVGLPLHHYLARRRRNDASTYAGMGAAVTLTTAAILFFLFPASPAISKIVIGAVLLPLAPIGGAVGGLTFWFIRRPDRDAVNAPPQP